MRVVLAMSGGVDSSAAAVLLQQQGYEVISHVRGAHGKNPGMRELTMLRRDACPELI